MRELNRATLARQLLLRRTALPVPRAVERLCALQAQWPTAPYVGLWSRLAAFDRAMLERALERRTVVRGTLMRVTIHLTSARDFLALGGLYRARRREEHARAGADPDAVERRWREALAAGARTHAELVRATGPDERSSYRFGPVPLLVHVPPAGRWRHHGRVPLAEAEDWLGGRLARPEDGAQLLVERYLRAFGPASAADLQRFSGLRVRDLAPGFAALEPRLRRFCDEEGRELLDLRRAPLPPGDTPVPPRFLGRWDNALLGYERRARILPDEYEQRKIGLAGDQPFLVDGFVAGLWAVERAGRSATLVLEPLAPLPRAARRAVEDEAVALLAWHEPEANSRSIRWS